MAFSTKRKFIAAMIRHDGVQARVAEELGVSRAAVCMRLKKNPALAAEVNERLETMKDLAESAVFAEVRAEAARASAAREAAEAHGTVPELSDPKTSKWFLERKGRDRGYGGSVAVRLDDAAIQDIVDQVGQSGGVDALRKLAGGG